MKNIVVYDEYHEVDLKPSSLLQEYVKLSEEDVRRMFEPRKLMPVPCPACGSDRNKEAFVKFGMKYQECQKCRSLFISPRPDDKTLNDFYLSAPSRTFWRERLSKATDKKRKEKIIKPRCQWILDSTQEYCPHAKHWLDINTNQSGYIEEMVAKDFFLKKTLVNPFIKDNSISASTVNIFSKPWWDFNVKGEADVVSAFEVIDRVSDAENFLDKTHQMLKPGGLCFMTAILASGFDIQTLWEKSENLYPPDRLNVFTIEGLRYLFKRSSFEVIELSTPGILDMDIVERAIKQSPNADWPRFARYLIESKDEDTKTAFQEFLQANRMSSYGRILLKKK